VIMIFTPQVQALAASLAAVVGGPSPS
jgi:hypothetical protein